MQVYHSSFGAIKELTVVKETAKGYRVLGLFRWETVIYKRCPHGNHKTFLIKQEAVDDAMEYIEENETKAHSILNMMAEKRDVLLSA